MADFAGPTGIAHAEVSPGDAEAGDIDSPALPSIDETSAEPQMPQGSFDIPPQVVVDPAPSVEPIPPPPIGSAVATWQGNEELRAFAEAHRATSKSSSGTGATTQLPAEVAPAVGGEGAVAPSVSKPTAQRAPFLRTAGGCVARGTSANAAQVSKVLRPACIPPRSNLRLISTQLPG